jgi:hypothetical protein
MEDHLGVGMAAEGVALRLEFLAELAVVVDLAVEDELYRAVERLHGLVAERREIDDRETRVPESHRGAVVEERPGVVGAAMADRPDAAFERSVFETA